MMLCTTLGTMGCLFCVHAPDGLGYGEARGGVSYSVTPCYHPVTSWVKFPTPPQLLTIQRLPCPCLQASGPQHLTAVYFLYSPLLARVGAPGGQKVYRGGVASPRLDPHWGEGNRGDEPPEFPQKWAFTGMDWVGTWLEAQMVCHPYA